MVSLEERIIAHGHPNISATHRSTLEVTKESDLTHSGDCIIAVGADKGARDLSGELKQLLRVEGSRISLFIRAGELEEVALGRGHPKLSPQNPTSMVFRKSAYLCDRTVMIQADKAARSLSHDLVDLLRLEETAVELILEVVA